MEHLPVESPTDTAAVLADVLSEAGTDLAAVPGDASAFTVDGSRTDITGVVMAALVVAPTAKGTAVPDLMASALLCLSSECFSSSGGGLDLAVL